MSDLPFLFVYILMKIDDFLLKNIKNFYLKVYNNEKDKNIIIIIL